MSEHLEFDVLRVEEQLQVELVVGPDQERIVFRVEVLRSNISNAYSARVYRQDLFEVKVFGDHASELPGGVAHHELWVKDDFFSGKEFSASTADELREGVVESIRRTLQDTGNVE